MRYDLTYRVELWDADSQAAQRVLAMAADPSVAIAAFGQAVREFPKRTVIVRQRDRIVAHYDPAAR